MFKSEALEKKWQPILESKDAPAFKDNYRKSVTAVLLENQEKAAREAKAQASYLAEDGTETGAVQNWDPVLISLVRRSMPNLIAYDVAGVQPMSGPTGLIFAMKARYEGAAPTNKITAPVDGVGGDPEALFDTIDQKYSGEDFTETAASGAKATNWATQMEQDGLGDGVATATGEGATPKNMGFTVEKVQVGAQTRLLQASYTMELAQDLKAVHGLDAESELAGILSTEILAEINREVIGKINYAGKFGADFTTAPGTFDLETDADGRWAVEKFKSLLFQIEIEANAISKATRRGKGNYVICSSNVASALAAAGVLDYAPALATNLNVDDTGNTFAGLINGRLKVFIDPYSTTDYVTVGYKGTNSYDAGLYYCPYVPLTMVRAVDPGTFQPKIAFKTRYGLVSNPFADITGAITRDTNPYFRKFLVTGMNVGETA
jgi:hypothetical protein